MVDPNKSWTRAPANENVGQPWRRFTTRPADGLGLGRTDAAWSELPVDFFVGRSAVLLAAAQGGRPDVAWRGAKSLTEDAVEMGEVAETGVEGDGRNRRSS